MVKVYVSSTFLDLQDYRRKVSDVLREMGYEDVAMEHYVARSHRPADECLRDVAACNLYIGLFAWRYGYVPPDDNPSGLSITEMEYRQAARSMGEGILIFLLDDDYPWPPKLMDQMKGDATRILELRAHLSRHHMPARFKGVDDLGKSVATAVNNWALDHDPRFRPPDIPALQLDAYFGALRERYQRLDLEGLTPPQEDEFRRVQLRSDFVEQDVRENPPPLELSKELWESLRKSDQLHADELPEGVSTEDIRQARELYSQKPARRVLDVLSAPGSQRVVLLGDPGSGKSTLTRYLMLSLIDPTGDERLRETFSDYLPILIELRSYMGLDLNRAYVSFLEYLEHLAKGRGWNLTASALHNYLEADGRALVIFDGLDEVFDPRHREEVAERIAAFARNYPKARVVVTSRIIGYSRQILTGADFLHFTLQDLEEPQVRTFIERWYGLALSDRPQEASDRSRRIMSAYRESSSIRQLAGNPMLLTIMAIIGRNQELPRERWKLYEHAANVLIRHWDVERHLKAYNVELSFISDDDKKEILRRLAHRMQEASRGAAGNYIRQAELKWVFADYLKQTYELAADRAAYIAGLMIDQFRERNFVLSRFGYDLHGFVHRGLMEYFCADWFVDRFGRAKKITDDQLKTDVFGRHWEDPSWHEVLRLICGKIHPSFAGQVIDYLTGEAFPSLSREFGDRPPLNLALAVQCLGEMENPIAVAGPAENLLRAIYDLFNMDMNDRPVLHWLFKDKIVPTVELIGMKWPRRASIADLLRRQEPQRYSYIYDGQMGKFVGALGKGLNEVKEVLRGMAGHESPELRVLVPHALASGWTDDPDTLRLLRELIEHDPHRAVRYAAIDALGQYFSRDEGTFLLLVAHANNDPESWVRASAINALAENYPDRPATLSLLRERAIAESDRYPRNVAVAAIAEHFHDDPETFPLLIDKAMIDPSPVPQDSPNPLIPQYVREQAMIDLARFWPNSPKVLQVLDNRAKSDPVGWLSEKAKHLLDDLRRRR
jgi:hypothetical protein